jgi:hypothetical protein
VKCVREFFPDLYKNAESWNNPAAPAVRLKVIYQGGPAIGSFNNLGELIRRRDVLIQVDKTGGKTRLSSAYLLRADEVERLICCEFKDYFSMLATAPYVGLFLSR